MKCDNYQLLYVLAFLLTGFGIKAQGLNVNNMHVGSGVELHSACGAVTIGNNVITNRSATPGIISFGALPSDINVTGYIDGLVRIYNNTGSSYFPVGNGTTASPIAFADIANPALPFTASYSALGSGNTTLHNQALFMVLNQEQWNIKGSNTASVTLRWNNNSGIAPIASAYSLEISDIVIAAWDGMQWIAIPSLVNSGSAFTQGSLTTLAPVNFNQYSLFTIALKRECAEIVDATDITVWNGSWSNGLPTEYKMAIINTPFTVTPFTSFSANSLELNAEVTIQNGAYLDVVKGVSGTAILNIASEGSFVQRSSAGQSPQIVVEKTTRPLRKWDNAYWGPPVQEDIKNQIPNATAVGYQMPALENALKYVSEAGADGSWKPLTATVPGHGFITRIKSQPPFINNVVTAKVNFPMQGTANNGNVTVQLGSAVTGARSYNLLANPYPSAIDAGAFLRENPNLGGAIYLWTSNGFNSSGTTADYAIWTMAGSVAASPIDMLPTGYIASGQGFMVKGLTANGEVVFNNCMRVDGDNDNFFRSANENNRYWLNLTNEAGIFSQILVNYMEEAIYGYDRLYDAPRNSVSSSQLYSYIENSKYAINSRPDFDVADVVRLGVSRVETDTDNFTISLHQPEGVFTDDTVIIYLHDKLLGIYHNLKQGNYSFIASDLQNNERFEIVYEAAAMGTGDIAIQVVAMTINNGNFSLNSKLPVSSIAIYEITGRLIQQYNKVNNTVYNALFNHAQGVYIAKAILQNGTVATQKLINGR